ncbi:hypothetical protein C367_06168 [Cryptococcus neoformans Ze90-1]|nr:hypothetical protein C367_06168 [Cryptococcus neoformans var. grubii Ze90-1]
MSDDIDAIHTHRQVDNDAASSKVSEPANEEPPQPERYWHRLFRWHEVGTSPEEKWLIRKLDIFILSYACLTFFIKYVDQSNVTNAYVSGMRNDLHLSGNELNWMTTYFSIGIIVGAPFSTFVMTILRPSIWLPLQTIIWSCFVLFIYKCETATQIYVLRFFIGLFESAAFPAMFYIIGSWYRQSEINRRSAIFMLSSYLGSMFSGYLQSGLYTHMEGKGGLRAWRWLFIFDFVIGIPIAIFGAVFFPDEPHTTKVFWLNNWERQRAIERIAEEGREPDKAEYNWRTIRRVLTSWQLWVFAFSWGLWELTCGVNLQRWVTLYLDSLYVNGHKKYSVQQVNNLPTLVNALTVVFMIASGIVADVMRTSCWVILGLSLMMVFCFAVLVAWPAGDHFKLAIFYLLSCYGSIGPLLSSQLNISCAGDNQLRSFATGFMISIGYAVETPSQQYMFPASQAPRYWPTHGYVFSLVWACVVAIWIPFGLPVTVQYFRSRRKEAVNAQTVELSQQAIQHDGFPICAPSLSVD